MLAAKIVGVFIAARLGFVMTVEQDDKLLECLKPYFAESIIIGKNLSSLSSSEINTCRMCSFINRKNILDTGKNSFAIFQKSESFFSKVLLYSNGLEIEDTLNLIRKINDISDEIHNRHRIIKCVLNINVNNPIGEAGSIDKSLIENIEQLLLDAPHHSQNNPLYFRIKFNNTNYEQYFIGYRIDKNPPSVILKQIFYNNEDSARILEFCLDIVRVKHETNFHQTVLKINVVDEPIYDFDTKLNITEGRIEILDSFVLDLMNWMQYLLNFTYILQTTTEWGAYRDFTWSGGLGVVINQTADISISSTALTAVRFKDVDYNIPTSFASIVATFRKLRGNSFGSSSNYPLLAPFSKTLWFTLVLWTLMSFILENVILHCFPGTVSESIEKIQLLPFSLNSICMQARHYVPTRTTLRILMFIEILVGVVLYAAYSGTLVAFLSAEHNSVSTLSELVSSKEPLVFSAVNNPSIITFLMNSTSTDHHKLINLVGNTYELKENCSKNSVNCKTLIKRVATEPFVLLSDDLTSLQSISSELTSQESCSIQFVNVKPGPDLQSSVVKKYSNLRKILDSSMIKGLESGNIYRWRKKHLSFGINCNANNERNTLEIVDFNGADLYDSSFAFHVLGITFIISVVSMLVERILYRKWKLRTMLN